MSDSGDYAELRAAVAAAGLLRRTPRNYLRLMGVIALLGAGAALLVVLTPEAYVVVAAPVLSLFWIQVGFVGHDAGHNQVFSRSGYNRWLGLVCFPLVIGMSFRPWVIRHNRHHVLTNVLHVDPDLDNKALALTLEAARASRRLRRWIIRYQAYLYPLLGLLATLAFRIDAWRYVLGGGVHRGRGGAYRRERRVELVLLAAWIVVWGIAPTLVLGVARWLPVFVFAQMILGLHLALVFAPNHKGMPVFEGGLQPSFLEHQVRTSRNVAGGWLVAFVYGGLNYQIEHHLFPTLPRPKLAACRGLVRAHCAAHGLPCEELSVPDTLRAVLSALDEIGRAATLGSARSSGVA